MSAQLQPHLCCRLNNGFQWIGQRQLQDETKNIQVSGFGVAYIRDLTITAFTFLLDIFIADFYWVWAIYQISHYKSLSNGRTVDVINGGHDENVTRAHLQHYWVLCVGDPTMKVFPHRGSIIRPFDYFPVYNLNKQAFDQTVYWPQPYNPWTLIWRYSNCW